MAEDEILLTGATGLIGREVLSLLLKNDFKVCAIEHTQKITPQNNLPYAAG